MRQRITLETLSGPAVNFPYDDFRKQHTQDFLKEIFEKFLWESIWTFKVYF